MIVIWMALAFLCGAIPFSVLIGRYGLRKDITSVGDGNPGATNVLRAGNFAWFSLALALDISKGAAPAGLASQIFDITGWQLALICLMPTFGHAFSPFLGGRGGKAIATAGGVWFGLDVALFSAVVAALIAGSLLVKPSGYAVLLAMLTLGLLLATLSVGASVWIVWVGQLLLFLYTHRADFSQSPRPFLGSN